MLREERSGMSSVPNSSARVAMRGRVGGGDPGAALAVGRRGDRGGMGGDVVDGEGGENRELEVDAVLVVDSRKSSGGPAMPTRRERGSLAVVFSDKEVISVDRDSFCSSVAYPRPPRQLLVRRTCLFPATVVRLLNQHLSLQRMERETRMYGTHV